MVDENNTIAFIGKVGKEIKFPQEIYEIINKDGEKSNFLTIIPNKNDVKKLILFPTNAKNGIHCKINILKKDNKLDDTFFLALREELEKYKVKTLFTTGICMQGEVCYWDGIFEYFDEFPLEEFKEALNKIKSVNSVSIKILNPTD
ncbi:MAG: hypothetical protein GY870_03200 [archaeon]|nr:hypothetical protein [archaeon]